MTDADPLLKASEVAEILAVHVNTVKRSPIPFFKVTGRGDRRYRLSDVRAFIREQTHGRGDPCRCAERPFCDPHHHDRGCLMHEHTRL